MPSTPFRLWLPREIYEQMLMQARAELPNECCGLLAGQLCPAPAAGEPLIGAVQRCYPLINALASATEYESEPGSMFRAVRDLEGQGFDVLAVYHSHPQTPPLPSRKDRERNFSPEVVNLIISLQDEKPAVQAWWLTEEDQRAAEWEVRDAFHSPLTKEGQEG